MGPVVLLWFDVEDYINEESDDALLALLQMLAAKGVRGTFKLVGEKVRALEARGCSDILDALKHQAIGYHTDLHSQHPTVSEYCEPQGFAAGAALFERREAGGLEDLRRLLPVPVSTYGQPGASWAAQAFPVLRKWQIPTYVDSIDIIDLDQDPFWFCGILTVTHIRGTLRMALNEQGLDEAIRRFDQLVADGERLISIYYHPCEFATAEFWDAVNFKRGSDTPRERWKRSRLRAPGEMERDVQQLGRWIDHMLARQSMFLGTDELMGAPGFGSADSDLHVTKADVRALAAGWREAVNYAFCQDSWLCASEIFSLLGAAFCGQEPVPVFAYGPERRVKSDDGAAGLPEDYRTALQAAWPRVMGEPQLPECFILNGKRVSPVDMACTVATMLCEPPDPNQSVPVVRGVLAPERHVSDNRHFGDRWVIFPENWTADGVLETTRLQTWTLKPAAWRA